MNGRNITTVVPVSNMNFALNSSSAEDDEWVFAHMYPMKYDLTGLTVAGASQMLARLGLTVSVSALKVAASSMIVEGIFQTGAGIEDQQFTYYKNIDQSRPDMRIDHEFYLYFELFGERQVEEYLGGFTTYYYN